MKLLNKVYGFTLIEIVIVLGLISLLSVVGFVDLGLLDRQRIRIELEKLETICRYLQQKAMTNNNTEHLVFDVKNKSYSFENTTQILPFPVQFGNVPGALGPPSSPSHAISSPVTFTNNRIEFLPSGIIQSGTVYLTDNQKRYSYALSSPINDVSYLRTYVYASKSWRLHT